MVQVGTSGRHDRLKDDIERDLHGKTLPEAIAYLQSLSREHGEDAKLLWSGDLDCSTLRLIKPL